MFNDAPAYLARAAALLRRVGVAGFRHARGFSQMLDLVRQVPFFQALDPDALNQIACMLRRVELPERTVVIRRGTAGDCMYFIAAGEVAVELQPAPIRLGTGDFFGEIALLGAQTRTADVSTTQRSILLRLDLADFRRLVAQHAELGRIIEAEGKRRLGDNRSRREQSGPGDAGSR